MTREEQKENLLRLSGTDVRKCMKCGKCSGRCPAFKEMERCPRGVAPAAVIEAVRDTVVRMQNANGIKAEDIPPIVDELIPQQLLVSAYRKYNK